MLFPRRTWAIRVVEKIGIPIKSPEATSLISLLIWATKQDEKMLKSVEGKSLSVADITITWASHMERNASAVKQLSKDAKISLARAEQLLRDLKKAARAVAVEHKMTAVLQQLDKFYPVIQ